MFTSTCLKNSPLTAYKFLLRLEKRIDFITKTQQLAKAPPKEKTFAVFCLHPITKYFIGIKTKSLKFFASLICERTPKKDLIDKRKLKGKQDEFCH